MSVLNIGTFPYAIKWFHVILLGVQSEISIYEYTNIRIYEYTNIRICEYSHSLMWNIFLRQYPYAVFYKYVTRANVDLRGVAIRDIINY